MANITALKELRTDYIEMDNRAARIKQGETVKLNVRTVNRLNAFGGIEVKNLKWTSSNTDVATVSEDGLVTSVGLGETTITAKDETNKHVAQAIVSAFNIIVKLLPCTMSGTAIAFS